MTMTVEHSLSTATTLKTVLEIKAATGLDEATVRAQLRTLAQQGQIEHIPGRGRYDGRYGLLRPIAKDVSTAGQIAIDDDGCPKCAPDCLADNASGLMTAAEIAAVIGLDESTVSAELERLAQEASAPTDECAAWRDVAARYECTTPSELGAILAGYRDAADSKLIADRDAACQLVARMHAAAVGEVRGPIRGVVEDIADLRDELANVTALADKLEHLLGSERTANAALREQLDNTVSPEICSVDPAGYVVIAPKRPMRRFTAHDSAVKAAMSAAGNGSGRGEVFALVPVGVAKRGAVWRAA